MITATEAGTLGYSDREHLEFATERGWVLLTFDDDFPELVRRIDASLQRIESRDVRGEVIYP